MSSKQKVKSMVGNFIQKFKTMDSSTPELIRKNAWSVSEGRQDWERKVIYGNIMQRYSTPAMKKAYAQKTEISLEEAVAELKGEI